MMARGGLWVGLYIHLIILPLLVGAIWPGAADGRLMSMQFGVACGYVGLTVMILELALISKIQAVASVFGQDALLQFHRLMGMSAACLIGVHAALMLHNGYPMTWLNPFLADNPWAMRWGVLASAALLILIGLSLNRRALRLSYDWWELTHGLLADTAIALGFAHVILFAGFSAAAPMRAVLGCYACFAVGLRAWFKIVRPLRMWAKPWEVVENRPEHGDTHTLVLRPAGHPGFTFEPGQFAWLSTARTPFHWDRHPISMSSAASDEGGQPIAFTIKKLGDWSGGVVPSLEPGRRVWVDGPHGVFTADRLQGPGYVLIGGGSGISPLFSICQTLGARGDPRPVILFFASRKWDDQTFRERLEELRGKMNLKVVHVLEDPPVDWTGERGYVTTELLRRRLPAQYRRFQFFVCGPEPMMDAVEDSLRELGVPAERIHTERFVMV